MGFDGKNTVYLERAKLNYGVKLYFFKYCFLLQLKTDHTEPSLGTAPIPRITVKLENPTSKTELSQMYVLLLYIIIIMHNISRGGYLYMLQFTQLASFI